LPFDSFHPHSMPRILFQALAVNHTCSAADPVMEPLQGCTGTVPERLVSIPMGMSSFLRLPLAVIGHKLHRHLPPGLREQGSLVVLPTLGLHLNTIFLGQQSTRWSLFQSNTDQVRCSWLLSKLATLWPPVSRFKQTNRSNSKLDSF
jgi:hypothetical protein